MTFIHTVNDKTNIDVVVSDTIGDQEARDDPRVRPWNCTEERARGSRDDRLW